MGRISKRYFVDVELNISLIFFIFSDFFAMSIYYFHNQKKQEGYFYFKNSMYEVLLMRKQVLSLSPSFNSACL